MLQCKLNGALADHIYGYENLSGFYSCVMLDSCYDFELVYNKLKSALSL